MKILASLFLGLGLLVAPISYEEGTSDSGVVEETPVFEEKTYVYNASDGTATFTLISETECVIKLEANDMEPLEKTVEYTLENGIFTVYNEDTSEIVAFTINEDGTLTEYLPEATTPCNVELNVNNLSYGDIITDIESGNVGDIVTVKVTPNFLCKVVSVSANGTQLVKNEAGYYTFALVEGQNIISAEFAVDNEELTYLVEQFANAKAGNWEAIFSVENLLTFISWAISLVLSSGFFITLIKNRKVKVKTQDEISATVKAANAESIINTVNEVLEKVLSKTLGKYLEKTDSLDESVKVLVKCFCLSQENTPEARLAIMEELTKLNQTQKDLTAQIKQIINEEIAKNKEIANSKHKTLEDLKAANEKITKVSSGDDSYGQI